MMKTKEIFNSALGSMIYINPSKRTFDLLQRIERDLSNIEPIDYFFQTKKNERGEGLAMELMFFDNRLIYDIVCTKQTIHFNTLLIKSIAQISIETNAPEITAENIEKTITDFIKMSIISSKDHGLEYSSDTRRFDELNRVKNNLLKLL